MRKIVLVVLVAALLVGCAGQSQRGSGGPRLTITGSTEIEGKVVR